MRKRIPFLKRTVRWLIAWIAYYSGLLTIWRRIIGDRGPIMLAYHRVLDDGNGEGDLSPPGTVVSLRAFREQMEYLKRNYDVVSLEELLRRKKEGRAIGHVAAVTFDDGWRDVYSNAYPILLKYGIPATVFLVTQYVGTTQWFWPEKIVYVLTRGRNRQISIPESMRKCLGTDAGYLRTPVEIDQIGTIIEHLKSLGACERESITRYLTEEANVGMGELETKRMLLGWEEVEEMANNGISFGSHSQTHCILTQVPVERARSEIRDSRKEVEVRLGKPCLTFAYPNGDWNEQVRRIVVESNYECACSLSTTLCSSGMDFYSMTRRVVHEGFAAGINGKFSKCVFAAQIAGLMRPPVSCLM